MTKRRVTILGATGSVGLSTVSVIEERQAQGDDIVVEAVTAGANLEALADVVARLRPQFVAVADARLAEAARARLPGFAGEIGFGPQAVVEAAQRPADWVMASIVGAAGLAPTLAALERGADVALANKECLVCAGDLMCATAARTGAKLLPVDSEHSAIFQVWEDAAWVEKITLTASGGPFRAWTKAATAAATPEQACAHPTWRMGPKISVDSATLMNKGFELIEAVHLFGLPEAQIEIVLHPQSVIHSLVHYVDGSVLAQLSAPDMRVPIAFALGWPERLAIKTRPLDLVALGALTFEAPDPGQFPALPLVREALRQGCAATCALNAANEVAVGAFLAGRIGFADIVGLNARVLEAMCTTAGAVTAKSPRSLAEVQAVDAAARRLAEEHLQRPAA